MHEDDKKREGKRIREIREGLDMTREEMAARLGVGQSTIRNVENGHQRMGARTLARAEQLYRQERYESPCPSPDEVHDAPESFQSYSAANGKHLPDIDSRALESIVLWVLEDATNPDVQLAADAIAKALGKPKSIGLATIIARRIQEQRRLRASAK